MIISRHASYRKSRPGRNGVSRSQSRCCAHAGVREGRRLPGVRAGVERDAGRIADADMRLLPDAQPLAFACLARTRWRLGSVHAALDDYPRSPLAGEPALCRPGACLPRALQVVSGGGRRAFLGGRPVRRTQLRCAPTWFCVRRSGVGRVFGGVVVAAGRKSRSWPGGRWTCPRIGWSESTAPTTRRNWRRCGAASSAGGPTGRRNGSGDCQASGPGIRVSFGGPAEDRGNRPPSHATPNRRHMLSYFANIGPVPFSSSNIGPVPFSSSWLEREETVIMRSVMPTVGCLRLCARLGGP